MDNGVGISLKELVDSRFKRSLSFLSFQVVLVPWVSGILGIFGAVFIIVGFVVEVSLPGFKSQKTVHVEDFKGSVSGGHRGGSGGGGHIRVEVVVNVGFPFISKVDGVGHKSALSFLSKIIRDEETSDGSLNLEISCSSLLEKKLLIRMASLSDNIFVKNFSSELSFGEKSNIFVSKTSLMEVVKGEGPDSPGESRLKDFHEEGRNAAVAIVMGKDLFFEVDGGSEPFGGSGKVSLSAEDLSVYDLFPKEFFESHV